MKTPSNYSIPLLTAIGNHESGGFRRPLEDDAYYIRYFPHELDLPCDDPMSRPLYHTHVFAHQVVYVIYLAF